MDHPKESNRPPKIGKGVWVYAPDDGQGPEVGCFGYEPIKDTQTNNGVELWAALEALQGLWVPKLAILTDSVSAVGGEWQSPQLKFKGMDHSVGCAEGKCASTGITPTKNEQAGQTSAMALHTSMCMGTR